MGGRWLLLAGWAAASGCVVSVGDKPAPLTPTPVTAQAPPPREFASIRPGDYVPAHPELAATDPPPRPAEPPPLTVPAFKPAAATEPLPPDSPLVAAVRHLEAGRRPEAEVALAALPHGAGTSALPLLAAAVQSAGKGGSGGASEAVRVLEGAAAGLAPRAQLEVVKAVFCSNVKGFGQYDPLPTDRPTYPAGKRPTVFVYLELRNVVAVPDGDRFVPRLVCSVQVQDAAGGQVVYQKAGPPDRELPRSPSRDNYVGFHFPAPDRPGTYTVTLRAWEPAADGRGVTREVQKPLTFHVR